MSLSQFTTVLYHCTGEIRQRHGSEFWTVPPSNMYACSDGWVYVNIVPTFWDPFCTFLDAPELILDERFQSNDLRMENREALNQLIAERLIRWSRAETQARANEARIPLGTVLTFAEVLDDAHLATRRFWESVDVDGQHFKSPALPFHLNAEPRHH